MIKISEKLSRLLFQECGDQVGIYTEQGACVGNCKFVIIYKPDGDYLAHISELEQDGVFIRMKK